MSSSPKETIIYWFRNDLRLDDNPGLPAPADTRDRPDGGAAEPSGRLGFLPVYIFPPRLFGRTRFGFPKVGPHRARFLRETLEALCRSLRERGSDLLVLQGEPGSVLSTLARRYRAREIRYQDEPGTEEAEELRAVAEQVDPGVRLRPHWGQTLYHIEDLPFTPEEMPNVYTEFRKAVEKGAQVREPLPTPDSLPPLPPLPASAAEVGGTALGMPEVVDIAGAEAPAPDPRAAIHFTGGERPGAERLAYYLWDSDALRRYRYTRNGLLGADYSSKFSPWLANGSLSPRRIYAEVKRYERERVKNDSTYWLGFELIWRDYFAFLARKYPSSIFRFEGPMQRRYPWTNDHETFELWRQGRTGQDFIDANMTEIAATGYMSNRGRQNVASYLARDLKVNWLMGAEWFESRLIDYDPASNYGNWSYNVGVGTDPRRDRYFNPERQAEKYDPKGRYRRHWLEPDLFGAAGGRR
jgi:deoxyribodipyrimidine photo-lyase